MEQDLSIEMQISKFGIFKDFKYIEDAPYKICRHLINLGFIWIYASKKQYPIAISVYHCKNYRLGLIHFNLESLGHSQ